jgi:hypothetical protein
VPSRAAWAGSKSIGTRRMGTENVGVPRYYSKLAHIRTSLPPLNTQHLLEPSK